MKKLTFILLISLFIPFYQSNAQYSKPKDKSFLISLDYYKSNAPSIFDIDGEEIINHITKVEEYDKDIKTGYEMDITTVQLGFEYYLFEDFQLNLNLPLSSYTIYEEENSFVIDTSVTPVKTYDAKFKSEQGMTRLMYIDLAASYRIDLKNTYLELLSNFKLATGTSDVNIDTSKFISDGANQFINGIRLGIEEEKIQMSASLLYSSIGEDYSDQFIINTHFGFSNIENTMLYLNLRYRQSLEKLQNIVPLESNIYNFPLASTELRLGLGFKLIFDDIKFDFGYDLLMMGKNTWKAGIVNIRLGYYLF